MTNYKLTQSQLSIWMGQKLNPHAPLYNMAHTFQLFGDIHVSNFKKAFDALLQQVDALRCVFLEENDLPYQYIKSSLSYEMGFLDLTSYSKLEIQNKLQVRTQKIFDLSTCVFDTIIIKADNNHYIWFLNIHHIVTDATTSTILFKLMGDFYKDICELGEANIKHIPQFESFIKFEADKRVNPKNEDVIAYWKEKISPLKDLPELYGNKNKGSTTKACRIAVPLGKERSAKLLEIIQRPDVRSWTKDLTLFNIISSILFIYIYRISGQKLLVIGAPSHNRLTKVFKETPGIFIEFFPLIAEIEADNTYFDILQRVKLETNNYLRYAQPGTSNANLNKVYNVTLNFINTKFADFNGIPYTSEWIHPDHIDEYHALRCNVYDMNNSGELSLLFDMNAAVFSNNLSEIMPKHFLSIFDDFISNIDKPILNKSIAVTDEIDFFLSPKLGLDLSFTSILECFEAIVKENPNAEAISVASINITYIELNTKANQLAHYLVKKGFAPNSKVVLSNYRSIDFIVSIIAVMKLGGVFIPVSSDQPSERLKYILSNAKPSLVLTHSDLKSIAEDVTIPTISLDVIEPDLIKEKTSDLGITPEKTDLAYILYTSGSTGKPKGVKIQQKALSNYLFWAKDYYEVDKNSVFPLFTSIGFDLTITTLFLPLLIAGKIVVYREDKTDTDTSIVKVISENLVNSIKLTPSHLALLPDLQIEASKLKLMIVGGEDLKVNLAKSTTTLIGDNLKIYNEYGPTEATVGCIVGRYNVNKHKLGSVPIGSPIANMHAYILDEHKNMVPKGVPGELFLSGLSLADGYLELDDLSREKFIDNPFVENSKMYHTGDLARINNAGDFEYLGRIDEQIKLRGYRIELTDIEANFLEYKDIINCSVLVLSSDNRERSSGENEKLAAFYSSTHKIPDEKLLMHLSQRLPQYMIPSVFTHLEELPLTKNGKTDKYALKLMELENSPTLITQVAPRNEIEEVIHDIWKEVLKIESIGVNENFIRIGGSSLSAISITSRLKTALELDVAVSDIFNYPTIETYALYVEDTITKLLNE